MREFKSCKALTVLSFLVILCSASSVLATTPDWMLRPGTIGHALSLTDGSHVYLDAVIVDKIKAKQDNPYFTIHECFNSSDRIIVLTPPSPELRLIQLVDVEGTMTTLDNGCRAIMNPTVYGYTDEDGNLLRHGPLVKGVFHPTPWEWKVDLTVSPTDANAASSTSASTVASSEAPNDSPAEQPSYYPTITDILEGDTAAAQESETASRGICSESFYDGIPDVNGLPDGSFVELQCKRIIYVDTENINGTDYHYIDIAEDLPATDWIRAYCTKDASTTDRVNRITGQIRYVDIDTPVICVDTGPGYDWQDPGEGQLQTAAEGTIAWARTRQDGATVSLSNEVVMADRSDFINNILYVEEPNRKAGIRVLYAGTVNAIRGVTLTITGSISTLSNGERVIDAGTSGVQLATSQPVPTVLGMPNCVVGGTGFNCFTLGINSPAGHGLYNEGLLLKSWGTVTAVDAQNNYFYIDDGSGLLDGSGNTGAKISWDMQAISGTNPEVVPPSQDWYVTVTGISSSETPDSGTTRRRVIRPRTIDDILVLEPEDSTVPTPGSASSPTATNENPIQVNYTGASDTGGTALKKVELWYKLGTGGTWTPSKLMSTGTSGSFDYTPSTEGTYYFDLVAEDYAANRSADASGNGKDSTIYDTTAPTGTISISSGATYTNTTSTTLTLSGSDILSGIYQMRFSNNGSSWGSWESFNTSKSWTLASGDGQKTVYVQFKDNAGNSSGNFTDTIILDTAAPTGGTISIKNGSAYTNTTTVPLTLSASDATSGLYQMRFSNDNSVWSTWEAYSTSKTSWTLSSGDGVKTVYVQYKDNAGNTTSSNISDTITLDTTAPTCEITGPSSPTNSSPINFTITFSESVTGLTASEITVTNGTKGTLSGSGTTYTLPVTPSGQGAVTCQVTTGAAQDAATNGNVVSNTLSITYDSVDPTVTINQASGQSDPTNNTTINFTVIFNESVTEFITGDVTITGTAGGTKTATVTGSGTTYNVAVTGMTSSGTVIANIAADKAQDAAGNGNAAATYTDNTVTFDNTPPTVTVNQAAGQYDPTRGTTINFTVVFSESVTGFTNNDVVISGTAGGIKTAIVTGGGSSYSVAVTGMTSTGTVIATIIASAAQDAAGNNSTASTSTDNSILYVAPPQFGAYQVDSSGTVKLTWTYDSGGLPFNHEHVLYSANGVDWFQYNLSDLPWSSNSDYRVWGMPVGSTRYFKVVAYDNVNHLNPYESPVLQVTVNGSANFGYWYEDYLTIEQKGRTYTPAY